MPFQLLGSWGHKKSDVHCRANTSRSVILQNPAYHESSMDPRFIISKTFKAYKVFNVLLRKIMCSGIDFSHLSQIKSKHAL